ncbi:hypothetical protein Y032_0089g2238 [Ancylostoma ceylanicum]|nr:hypothetical protein Y032_0089g2238 [Ancylostoma ceylanicum]
MSVHRKSPMQCEHGSILDLFPYCCSFTTDLNSIHVKNSPKTIAYTLQTKNSWSWIQRCEKGAPAFQYMATPGEGSNGVIGMRWRQKVGNPLEWGPTVLYKVERRHPTVAQLRGQKA